MAMNYTHQSPVREWLPDESPASSMVSPDPVIRSTSSMHRTQGGAPHTPRKWGVDDFPDASNSSPFCPDEAKGSYRGNDGLLYPEQRTMYTRMLKILRTYGTAIRGLLFSLFLFGLMSLLFRMRSRRIMNVKSSTLSLAHLTPGNPAEHQPGLGLRSGVRLFDWNPANEKLVKRNRIKKLHVIFYDGADPHANDIEDAFGEVAAQFYRQAILHVRVKREFMRDFQFFLPEDPENTIPFSVIVEANHGFRKYRFPHDINAAFVPSDPSNYKRSLSQQLASFEEEYFAGGLRGTPWLRSEAPYKRDEQDGSNVVQLVGDEFQSTVVKGRYDALVFFYAPWCGHCKRFEGYFTQLAEILADAPSLKFFKMDVTKNDVDHPAIDIHRVPHVRLFKLNDKGHPLVFEHAHENLVEYGKQFLLEHASVDASLMEL